MAQVTLLSTADFGAAVWTNKQHLAVRLADHFDVTYVESLGLRTPRLNASDVRRVVSRLGRRGRRPTDRAAQAPVRVAKPRVVPLHAVPPIAALNRSSLRQQFRRRTSEGLRILWSFSPVTYGLEDEHDVTIYHSVDLLHELPGVPRETLLRAERALVRRADAVIASSAGVRQHLESMGAPRVRVWENVADVELYASAIAKRRERVVFAGNLTSAKIEFELLSQLASSGLDLVLAGPRGIDGTGGADQVDDLLKFPNVEHVGNLRPPELAELLASCTVGVIPYSINSYTTGVFPMKVFEYLAAGLAVISTPLPSLVQRSAAIPQVSVVDSLDFLNTVIDSLPIDPDAIAERRGVAASQSWERRTEQAVTLIGQYR